MTYLEKDQDKDIAYEEMSFTMAMLTEWGNKILGNFSLQFLYCSTILTSHQKLVVSANQWTIPQDHADNSLFIRVFSRCFHGFFPVPLRFFKGKFHGTN
jgi:hypothetical protein